MNKKEEKRTKLRWGAFYCLLFAVFALMIACHKTPVPDPEPEQDPETPDTAQVDTTTYPDTITLTMRYLSDFPNIDSVIFYASKSSVKKIIMNLLPRNTTGWVPLVFNICRDSLQLRIDVAPSKVRGAGTIYVGSGGTQWPNPTATNISAMSAEDYDWYTAHGWEVVCGWPFKE